MHSQGRRRSPVRLIREQILSRWLSVMTQVRISGTRERIIRPALSRRFGNARGLDAPAQVQAERSVVMCLSAVGFRPVAAIRRAQLDVRFAAKLLVAFSAQGTQ